MVKEIIFDILKFVKEFFKNLPYPYKLSLFIGFIFISGMLLGSFGYKYFFQNKKGAVVISDKIQTNPYPLPPIIEEQRETTNDAKRYNFLLMGHGGAGHSGGGLMDAIIIVSVNTTDKKATLISVPRDLYFSGKKINADSSIKDAVTAVTGLAISNFVTIDFNNFVKIIDALGGIRVDVKTAYTDNFYPIRGKENDLCGFTNEKIEEVHRLYIGFQLEKQFTCRYETISYPAGLNNMNGSDALKYVRSRHGDGDFGRSKRQYEVLKAILQKADIKNVKDAFAFVKTDLTLEQANEYISIINNPLEYSISYLGLSDENVLSTSKSNDGAYILIPKAGQNNYQGIKKYIEETI